MARSRPGAIGSPHSAQVPYEPSRSRWSRVPEARNRSRAIDWFRSSGTSAPARSRYRVALTERAQICRTPEPSGRSFVPLARSLCSFRAWHDGCGGGFRNGNACCLHAERGAPEPGVGLAHDGGPQSALGSSTARTAFVFFLLGGLEALLIRAQLAARTTRSSQPRHYNELFTMHGTTMIFLALMPLSVLQLHHAAPRSAPATSRFRG